MEIDTKTVLDSVVIECTMTREGEDNAIYKIRCAGVVREKVGIGEKEENAKTVLAYVVLECAIAGVVENDTND